MRTINTRSLVLYWILSVSIVFGITSCRKTGVEGGGGPPTITRVRTIFRNDTNVNVVHRITLDSSSTYSEPGVAAFDSTTTDGKIGTSYAIIGTNLATTSAVYLNGVSIYFNPAYLSDHSIQINIPNNVPYSNSTTPNILTVVNPHGKANFNFIIEQPQPGITTISQLAGNPGDVLTITGTTFNGLTGVSFGTIPGTVVTSSPTVITVQVPSGVTAAPILITTAATKGGGTGSGPLLSSGTSILTNNVTSVHSAYGIFGFSTAVFEDQLENSWYDYGWSNSPKLDSVTVKRGKYSIKVSYNGGYDGFGFGVNNAVPATKNAAVKFSLYGGKNTNGKNVHFILNGNFNVSVQISLVEGKWTDYIVPIANFVDSGNPLPTSINGIVFQEFSGNASVFYIDDVGIVDIK